MAMSANPPSVIDLLLEHQIISAEQADTARKRHQETGVSAEQVLVDTGVLTPDDLAVFVGEALHIRYLKLEDVEIDREAVRFIPAAVAHRHKLIPLRRSGNALAVVFADPSNADANIALRAVTDFEIIPFLGREDAIEHALYVHYGDPPPQNDTPGETTKSQASPQWLVGDDRVGHMGRSIQINRQWVFDLFISDAANQFPLSVAHSVAEFQADADYNPFLCWGPSGCGKSHLLHAIVNHVASHSPLKRCLITTGRRFSEHLFEAIRDQKLNLFRYLYHELDILVIDDADELTSRDWAQAELVDTFIALRKKSKQLVLASRGNLTVHARITPKLRDILNTGVIAAFGEYSTEAKLAMLALKKGSVELTPETLTYLVRRCGSSVNDLMNLLQQVTVTALRGDRGISQEVVDDLIRLCGLDVNADAPQQESATASPAAHPPAATNKREKKTIAQTGNS
jgi:chromosomal replication initiation ATPase DnaA